jgi:hypothetical protein
VAATDVEFFRPFFSQKPVSNFWGLLVFATKVAAKQLAKVSEEK